MSGRVEYKYLVPNSLLDRIRDDMRPYVDADPFGGKGSTNEYTVRSVYYDTPWFDCYEEKLSGLFERKKFRIRGYDRPLEDSLVFLEIKHKHGDAIEKSRAPLLSRNLKEFLASPDLDAYVIARQKRGMEKRDAHKFLYHYHRYGLRPVALVVYDREAFFGKFDKSVRLTFDKGLRGVILPSIDMLYEDSGLEYIMRHTSTMEVKFFRRSLPGWIVSIIKRYELPRMALSKYAMTVELLRGMSKVAHRRVHFTAPMDTQWVGPPISRSA